MSRKAPPIVAELGRPETPEETAARKAESSRTRRANQTALNLVIALVASLGIVAFLVLVVVRPDATARQPVDYAGIAAGFSETVPLAAPPIPADWYANDARIRTEAGVRTWVVGFITGSNTFIGLDQGIGVDIATNPTWVSQAVNGLRPTGTMSVEGVEWTVYDHRDEPDPGNYAYALSAQLDGSVVVLHGTASDEDFELVASGVSATEPAR
jgi:hypothetical protein